MTESQLDASGAVAVDAGRGDDPIILITDQALIRIRELRDAEPDGEGLGLRLAIAGAQGPEFAYDLEFATVTTAPIDDVVRTHGDLKVMIPSTDVEDLRGATLDLPDESGLVLRNPNRPRVRGIEGLETTGPLVDEVQRVLAEEVNPSLAAHGGFVTLAGLEGGVVHLQMGGGCQGCAMSRMTMLQGVEVALKEAVPGVERVVDVTDHAAGENPFY